MIKMQFSPKRPNIVVVLPSYFEEMMGGAELQAKFLAEYANANHLNVSYIFLSDGRHNLNPLGIRLFPLAKRRIYQKIYNIKFPYTYSLLKLLKKIKPDIIYNRVGTALTGGAAYYAQKNHCPFVFHIAHDQDVQLQAMPWNKPVLIPEFKLMCYGIQRADAIIAQTQFQAGQLLQNYGRRATIISNGHPVPEDAAKNNDIIKVLWIANWKAIKQPEIFVKLAEEIDNNEKIHFVMLGRNDGYGELINLANKKNIEVRGEIPNEQVNELLANSHILVNTSQSEGFSNTFIQAWMRRVPVVSLQVDPDNILQREKIGFCSGNFEKLVEDTKRLITDHNLRDSIGHRAREYAIEHHSLDNMKQVLQVFHDLLDRASVKRFSTLPCTC